MTIDVFTYSDYRTYLRDWILAKPKRGYGQKARLAQFMQSPVSHISQVLSGVSHLSAEQAEEANEFLGHGRPQAEFFLLLVQRARAGSAKLQRRLDQQIAQAREARLNLRDRLGVKSAITREDEATFYSSWLYVAIHILLTIPRYRSVETVARYFNISSGSAQEYLDTLVTFGLVARTPEGYQVTNARVHLGKDSPLLSRHHINWRLQAIRSLENERASEALHYSSVVSVSRADAQKIKSDLVRAIESAKAVVKDSPEEELHSFCLDFFRV